MRRLLTPGWLACHLLALVLVVGMLWLAAWQLSRAAGGNALSWGYLFQWPVFAGFVGFVWAREVRRVLRHSETAGPADTGFTGDTGAGVGLTADDGSTAGDWVGHAGAGPSSPGTPGSAAGRRGAGPAPARGPVITRRPATALAYDDSGDPELAAYNRYLRWLAANPTARPVDYPG